jgi:hypothetical protein
MNNFKLIACVALLATALLGCSATARRQHELSERQKTAMAMFNERCKRAGELIHRTVDDVEGIFLMKVRPVRINYGDQYALDDPYGRDLSGGGGYIESFLRGSYDFGSGKKEIGPASRGYLYVETVDPKDAVRYRYTGSIKEVTHVDSVMSGGDGKTTFNSKEFVVEQAVARGEGPRYGVTYDDVSTHEERDYWIAGSSLKVIDLHTNEIVAERLGYMVDLFQGSRAGGRSPWLFAADHACPAFPGKYGSFNQARQTERFVEKVLKPKE